MPEQPFVTEKDLQRDPLGLNKKVFLPGNEPPAAVQGDPKAYKKAGERAERMRAMFSGVFDTLKISGKPGSMGIELRAKLLNDINTATDVSQEGLRALIIKSLGEFKQGLQRVPDEKNDLKGLTINEQGISLLVNKALEFKSSKK